MSAGSRSDGKSVNPRVVWPLSPSAEPDRSAGALGPHLSGLLAPFPIITSVLAIFTYAHAGVDQVVLLLRSFLHGFYGFAAFCFVLVLSLPDLSTAAAFGAATVSALIVQSATLVLRSRLAPTPLEQGA
jgi:hypothetical protein